MNKETKNKLGYFDKGRADISMLLLTKDNPLHCDKCKEYLGILHSARYALFKKKGSEYYVKCKNCGWSNRRIKGELRKQLDKRWNE